VGERPVADGVPGCPLVEAGGAQEAGPRPLDRDRAGFMPGEAAACVILESWPSARRRAAVPVTEVVGVAQALDGNALPMIR
jgi:malonyl-ACP decarboxylase